MNKKAGGPIDRYNMKEVLIKAPFLYWLYTTSQVVDFEVAANPFFSLFRFFFSFVVTFWSNYGKKLLSSAISNICCYCLANGKTQTHGFSLYASPADINRQHAIILDFSRPIRLICFTSNSFFFLNFYSHPNAS